MTGAFLRAKRDGQIKPVEVEYLTPEERREALGTRTHEELLRWLDVVCGVLVGLEQNLDALVREGVLQRQKKDHE